MKKLLVALGAAALALSSVGVAEAAKKAVPKVTKEAKVKYKSKCKAPLKWNAVEAKCEKKKVAKAKPKAKAAKKAA